MDSEQQRASDDAQAHSAHRLALIEVEGRDGRPQRLVDVRAWPLTLGRAIDNDIVIDDPHVAAHHARLALGVDGALTLHVLDSDNGVQLGRRRVARDAAQALDAGGATLMIGTTTLRLRLPGEVLAPEKPLPTLNRHGTAMLLAAGALMLLLEFAGHWVTLDPGADYSTWPPFLIGLPVGIAAWCAMWALLSKLFRHRFDFTGHLRIVLPWLLLLSVISTVWAPLCAALALPALWHWAGPLQALLLALLVRAHLAQVLPAHPRAVTAAVLAGALAWGGISLANVWRATDGLHAAPYMSTLPMPALRWAGTVPSATLVQDMAPLAAKLAQRAKKAREEDRDGGSDDEAGDEE